MEVSYHVNLNTILYRKGAVHRTEIEKTVIFSNVHVYSFTGVISHVHEHFSSIFYVHVKWFCMHKIFCPKN